MKVITNTPNQNEKDKKNIFWLVKPREEKCKKKDAGQTHNVVGLTWLVWPTSKLVYNASKLIFFIKN